MKVKELIEYLSKFDDEQVVYAGCTTWGFGKIREIHEVEDNKNIILLTKTVIEEEFEELAEVPLPNII